MADVVTRSNTIPGTIIAYTGTLTSKLVISRRHQRQLDDP